MAKLIQFLQALCIGALGIVATRSRRYGLLFSMRIAVVTCIDVVPDGATGASAAVAGDATLTAHITASLRAIAATTALAWAVIGRSAGVTPLLILPRLPIVAVRGRHGFELTA